MILSKKYLQQINPKQKIYNAKYSQGTYNFLKKHQNKDITIYWDSEDNLSGCNIEFNENKISSRQILFCFHNKNEEIFGTCWMNIMVNKYQLYDYSYQNDTFQDITNWFFDNYLKIGRCLFDDNHVNFLLGENHNYVKDEERFNIINGHKTCKWCEKIIFE